MEINVIGGGLAGVEAAFQIARRGRKVRLHEMRPAVTTPAHRTPLLSELVCSNSLKSRELSNAHGLLKEEMRRLGSLVLHGADRTAIPGGKALVVDREEFARFITGEIESNPLIEVIRGEVTELPGGICVIATGPLTSDQLAERIREMTGSDNLHFFDAVSPIVEADSVDMDHAFFASRYMENAGDYLNCPLSEEEYRVFLEALLAGATVPLKDFEDTPYFEGCLPVEVMAARGRETLLFGPMKPVGLIDPRTGRRPHAVIQLRKENASGSMYNMVGFQTKLTYPEQDRIFRLIPALRKALFFRYGSVHRNTYINAPALLTGTLNLKKHSHIFFAGQITGVEGYVESAATGLVAGISALFSGREKDFGPPPPWSCVGALIRYLTTPSPTFQPMNINFGLVEGYRKREKERVAERALAAVEEWGKGIEERT